MEVIPRITLHPVSPTMNFCSIDSALISQSALHSSKSWECHSQNSQYFECNIFLGIPTDFFSDFLSVPEVAGIILGFKFSLAFP